MISLTDQAASKIKKSLTKRGRGIGVRIGVRTTGCSGLAYVLEYVDYYWTYDEASGEWFYEIGTFTYNRHSKKPDWNDITELFLIEFYLDLDPIAPGHKDDLLYSYFLWQIPESLWDQIDGYWWNTFGNDHLIQVRIYPE